MPVHRSIAAAPFPSSPVRLSLAAKSVSITPCARPSREARFPCACLSVAARPVSVYPRVPFPSPQSPGPIPHRFYSASGKTRVAGLDCSLVYQYRDRYWRVNYSDQSSKISLFHFSVALGLGGAEQFLREILWVLFGRGTLGRTVWGVGFSKFVASSIASSPC